MANKYDVEVLKFSTLQEIDGALKASDFAALLDAMEYGDQTQLAEAELREMCLMSLQDLAPDEAAFLVLKHVIGGALKDSQLRNMSHEMQAEKLWEEYVDPAFHERLFNVGSLLYAAMPRSFPKTDAAHVQLKVTASDDTALQPLIATSAEALLVRLLADGMENNAVLNRLYGEQLAGTSFPNAAEIVWIVEAQPDGGMIVIIDIIGSGYWLDGLENTKSYGSGAHADKVQTANV